MFTKQTYRWFIAIMPAAVALNIILRLIPFDFIWNGHIPIERIRWQPLTIYDIPGNLLLFLPFGFGLSGVLAHRGRTGTTDLKIGRRVFIAGVLLSVILETIQLFMPERAPSLADVAANGIGALLGYGLFRAWEMGFGHALDRYVTRRNLLLGLALYALGAALLTTYFYRSVRLTNWDTSFPLVVGNEATGDRPWRGSIRSLLLDVRCDDPLPPIITADYDFSGEAPYENAGGRGDSPPLTWGEGPATLQGSDGVTTGPGEWLTTVVPFDDFSDYARHCHHIVIRTTVTSADPAQSGPARIVSISADAKRRNITLGQEGDALLIRLRTPAAGDNGHKPEIIVPGIFAGQQTRDLWVQYVAPMLIVRVDDVEEYRLSLAPGLAFFTAFKSEERRVVTMNDRPHRYNIAYGAILTGVALATVAALVAARRVFGREARRRQD